MRMFQSVSRHSSEQSTAHNSPRPTVSQLNGVSETFQTDFRITDHRGHKFLPSLTLLSFKTRVEWPPGWPQSQVFRAYFSTPAIFNATSRQAFRLKGLIWWQKLARLFQHFLARKIYAIPECVIVEMGLQTHSNSTKNKLVHNLSCGGKFFANFGFQCFRFAGKKIVNLDFRLYSWK